MSKSYNNCIYLSDSPDQRTDKIMSAKTDMGSEPGSELPEEGPVANLFRMLDLFGAEEKRAEYEEEYRQGSIQYGYLKQDLAETINDYFEEMDERRRELEKNPDELLEILRAGRDEAREVASETLATVKEKMGLAGNEALSPQSE